jgi:hypothetical protein
MNNTMRLYVDDSLESHLTMEALKKAGTDVDICYITTGLRAVPAIQSPLCTLYGYADIRRYLMPQLPSPSSLHELKATHNGGRHQPFAPLYASAEGD